MSYKRIIMRQKSIGTNRKMYFNIFAKPITKVKFVRPLVTTGKVSSRKNWETLP